MMSNLVKRTFNNGMFVDLFEAFKAESMTTGERQWFFLGMIVLLEAHTTFKYRIHYSLFLSLIY
jgi:hypothetical protein